jgi:hypothetical protein
VILPFLNRKRNIKLRRINQSGGPKGPPLRHTYKNREKELFYFPQWQPPLQLAQFPPQMPLSGQPMHFFPLFFAHIM